MEDGLGFYQFPDTMKAELLKVYRKEEALTDNYSRFYAFVHAHRSVRKLPELSNEEMKRRFFETVTEVGINNFTQLPNKFEANAEMLLARYGGAK